MWAERLSKGDFSGILSLFISTSRPGGQTCLHAMILNHASLELKVFGRKKLSKILQNPLVQPKIVAHSPVFWRLLLALTCRFTTSTIHVCLARNRSFPLTPCPVQLTLL